MHFRHLRSAVVQSCEAHELAKLTLELTKGNVEAGTGKPRDTQLEQVSRILGYFSVWSVP